MTDASIQQAGFDGEAQFGDYFALLKPRVMTLVVFTALVGLLAAPGALIRGGSGKAPNSPPAAARCGRWRRTWVTEIK